jgi:hypothetical protein
MPTATSSLAQLQKALRIAEQIKKLEEELATVLGWEVGNGKKISASIPKAERRGGKLVMSAETRAKMAASQQARWAGKKGPSTGPALEAAKAGKPAKKKRKLSAEGRARIVAALKARWAAA